MTTGGVTCPPDWRREHRQGGGSGRPAPDRAWVALRVADVVVGGGGSQGGDRQVAGSRARVADPHRAGGSVKETQDVCSKPRGLRLEAPAALEADLAASVRSMPRRARRADRASGCGPGGARFDRAELFVRFGPEPRHVRFRRFTRAGSRTDQRLPGGRLLPAESPGRCAALRTFPHHRRRDNLRPSDPAGPVGLLGLRKRVRTRLGRLLDLSLLRCKLLAAPATERGCLPGATNHQPQNEATASCIGSIAVTGTTVFQVDQRAFVRVHAVADQHRQSIPVVIAAISGGGKCPASSAQPHEAESPRPEASIASVTAMAITGTASSPR